MVKKYLLLSSSTLTSGKKKRGKAALYYKSQFYPEEQAMALRNLQQVSQGLNTEDNAYMRKSEQTVVNSVLRVLFAVTHPCSHGIDFDSGGMLVFNFTLKTDTFN